MFVCIWHLVSIFWTIKSILRDRLRLLRELREGRVSLAEVLAAPRPEASLHNLQHNIFIKLLISIFPVRGQAAAMSAT